MAGAGLGLWRINFTSGEMILMRTSLPGSSDLQAHDISKVIDVCLKYSDAMATADWGVVHSWISQGCDIDKDILPELRRIMQWKRGVTSLRYFTNAVMGARDKRIIAEDEEKKRNNKPESYYCGIFQWKKDRGLPLTEHELERLEKFNLAKQQV